MDALALGVCVVDAVVLQAFEDGLWDVRNDVQMSRRDSVEEEPAHLGDVTTQWC